MDKTPYRKHHCWECKTEWMAKVRRAKVGDVMCISTERSEFCPTCGQMVSYSTAWITKDGKDYFNQ